MSRIAVIGAGISGMAAAYLLSRKHTVWLYERAERLGGHTHTHDIATSRGVQPIDTGFIVHNERTYPNLVRLFHELGVARQKSDMSFGVSCQATGLEYSSRGVKGFFARRRNLLRPAHYKLFAEIARFNRVSTEFVTRGSGPGSATDRMEMTLGDYLRTHEFSDEMARLYLYPMASSVWSTSLDEIASFPVLTLLRFFFNHGFLTVNGHPQWYSVAGGSSSYIAPLTAPYRERVVTGAEIESVGHEADAPVVRFADGRAEKFDEVVFACHAPQALGMLEAPTAAEQSTLAAFRTTKSHTVLHTDARLLPRRADARASWNYHLSGSTGRGAATLTYHMNRLQNIAAPEDYCVSLNRTAAIDRTKVLREMEYFHPLYTLDAVRAQGRWSEISGARHLHFCGAYWFYGFHEDGLNSAIRVAGRLGVSW
jgi:predicted NAD/FAD-binding protein